MEPRQNTHVVWLWSVQSSGDFIDRYRATLVFYARVKSRAAFAEAFVRGYRRSMSADEIAGTLNASLLVWNTQSRLISTLDMQRVYNGYAEVRARSTWVNYYIMPIYFSCRTFRRHREYVTFHCFICDVFDRIQNTVKSESIYLYCINSLHNVDDEYFVHSVMQVLSVVELFIHLNKPQQTCRV